MATTKRVTLDEVAKAVGGTGVGDGSIEITGVAGIREAQEGELTFLANPRYEAYLAKSRQLGGRVFNMGGGAGYTMSLLELLAFLEKGLGRKIPVAYGEWRPADQKVYISDIRKAHETLGWAPKVGPEEGVGQILDWVRGASLDVKKAPRRKRT